MNNRYPKHMSFPDRSDSLDRPIPSDLYPVIDTDLGRDNLENDLPAEDLEEL